MRSNHGTPAPNGTEQSPGMLQILQLLEQRMTALNERVGEIHSMLADQRIEKEWYTTAELAEAKGVSQYTVQERWCNQNRIECEKDTESGKWRIPGDEYRRVVSGGKLHPPQSSLT